jgi:hypothetical protein
MGTFAIISGILSLLSTIGGVTGKVLSDKSARENVNSQAVVNDSGKGIGLASDVTGMLSNMLSFAGNMPSADRLYNKALQNKGRFDFVKHMKI